MPRLIFHATPKMERELKRRLDLQKQERPETNLSDVIRGAIEAGFGASADEIIVTQDAMKARGTQQLIIRKLCKALFKTANEVLSEFVDLDSEDET